jgi:8-oxo-dGTP pyrophosphatase MutT (NUDIX family)
MLCDCGGCIFKTSVYDSDKAFSRNRRKAGAVIFNPPTDSVLLVQSRGNLWGFPKGSIEENETIEAAAIREVREETGYELNITDLVKMHRVNNKVHYFESYSDRHPLHVQKTPGNDVNSLAWIKLSCIKKLIDLQRIQLNSHAKFLLKKIFKLNVYTK